MAHKFELEKYHGKVSRHECPQCHTKGVFSRYIDTETGQYLSFDVGRCNREDKCGYPLYPETNILPITQTKKTADKQIKVKNAHHIKKGRKRP